MTKRSRLSIVEQVIGFIGGVCLLGFKVLFGPSERSQAKKDGRKLVAEVETSFSSLLEAHGGRIQANKRRQLPPAFDSAGVILAFPEIRFRILRGRGEVRVQVAPVRAGENWHDLSLLWCVLGTPEHPTPPATADSLDTIANFLAVQWRVLVAAMGEGLRDTEEKLRRELPLDEQVVLEKKDVS